jgi:hypothetical protein
MWKAARSPRARDIGAVTKRTDEVCIERDQLALAHHLRAAFLHPRIRAVSRGQQPCFDPFAAELDALVSVA